MRKKFGVLFQDGALFGSMNLYDNVAFPLRQHTEKGEDEIREIVSRRLREVGLGGAEEKMPNELSGGMRKRAGFARALVLDPEIVLFDEPDSGLDPVRTALLCDLIKEVHSGERRHVRRDHARHRLRPPHAGVHGDPVARQDRRGGPARGPVRSRRTSSCASSWQGTRRAAGYGVRRASLARQLRPRTLDLGCTRMRSWSNLDVGALLGRLTSFSVRRAPLVVAVVVALSLLAALLALRLDPSASPSTFVDRDGSAAAGDRRPAPQVRRRADRDPRARQAHRACC